MAAGGPAIAASSDYGGFTWTTDRAEPQVFETLPNYAGVNNVLHIQTFPVTTDPANTGFYQTEGRFTLTNNPVGASFISGDLYIPAGFATSNGTDYVNIGLWGVAGLPPGTAESFPIINFYNGGTADPANPPNVMIQTGAPTANVGEIRVWDGDRWIVTTGVNAITSAGTINYGAWNTFRINYVPGAAAADGRFDVFLNGTLIQSMGCPIPGTNTCNDFLGGPIDPATDSLYSIILNTRTNGNSAYDVYWSRIMASLREEYYDAASLTPTAIVGGDILLGTYVDRRGLDWDAKKTAWMHAVGGVASFQDGNGQINSTVGGAQFGLDLAQLGEDPSTRLGVTAGYGYLSSTVGLPGGGSGGSSTGQAPSVGGYLTHADGTLYADLLGQYRFLNFDVTAPTSTGKVSGGSVDVAAEAGAHIALSEAFTLTPFGQLVYQHIMLNNTSLGGLTTSFGNSDALIGRVRVLAQMKAAGITGFASAGVSGDLLGAKQVVVAGTTFNSTIGGPRAELTAGVESGVSGGFNIFGSGEFDMSFDGKSQTYLGRAGIRNEF